MSAVCQVLVAARFQPAVESLQCGAGFAFEGRLTGSATWMADVAGAEADELLLGKVIDLDAHDAAASEASLALLDAASVPPASPDATPEASDPPEPARSALAQISCDDLESHEWDMHPFDFMNILVQAEAVAGVLRSALAGAAELAAGAARLGEPPACDNLLRLLCALKTNCHAITALTGDDDGEPAAGQGRGDSRLHVNAIGEARARRPSDTVHVVCQRRVGVGIYPRAAMMNHSCEPNCIVRFTGR